MRPRLPVEVRYSDMTDQGAAKAAERAMAEFPKTTVVVTSRIGRSRWIGNTLVPCVTEIMALDGRYGLYVRPSGKRHEQWELHGDPHPNRGEAHAAAARYRCDLRAELSDA
jgi:hypothetical protein